MVIYLNHRNYSLIIPKEVFVKIGSPDFFELRIDREKNIALITAATEKGICPIDVPDGVYSLGLPCVLPKYLWIDEIIEKLGWGKNGYAVEGRLVKTPFGVSVLVDFNKAVPTETVKGGLAVPTTFEKHVFDEDEDDDDDEEIEEDED